MYTGYKKGMNLRVKRNYFELDYTIGSLFIDDTYFSDTLEPTSRNLTKEAKVQDKTAIPIGTYQVKMLPSPHFGKLMPHLIDVPGFEYIMLHNGSYPKDTDGCILVGKNAIKGMLTESVEHFNKLYALIEAETGDISIQVS